MADQTYTLFVVCELFMALEATIIDIIVTSTAKLTMCHGMKLLNNGTLERREEKTVYFIRR